MGPWILTMFMASCGYRLHLPAAHLEFTPADSCVNWKISWKHKMTCIAPIHKEDWGLLLLNERHSFPLFKSVDAIWYKLRSNHLLAKIKETLSNISWSSFNYSNFFPFDFTNIYLQFVILGIRGCSLGLVTGPRTSMGDSCFGGSQRDNSFTYLLHSFCYMQVLSTTAQNTRRD